MWEKVKGNFDGGANDLSFAQKSKGYLSWCECHVAMLSLVNWSVICYTPILILV